MHTPSDAKRASLAVGMMVAFFGYQFVDPHPTTIHLVITGILLLAVLATAQQFKHVLTSLLREPGPPICAWDYIPLLFALLLNALFAAAGLGVAILYLQDGQAAAPILGLSNVTDNPFSFYVSIAFWAAIGVIATVSSLRVVLKACRRWLADANN